MIKISIEVCSGAARFRAGIKAKSIERAVRLANACYPDSEVRVLFPTNPDTFSGGGSSVSEPAVWSGLPEKVAG